MSRTSWKQTINLICLPLSIMAGCVFPYEPDFKSTVDVVVVDGTITNLAEPQLIRLNRSTADRLTGRFGTLPIKNATVNVIVDSSEVVLAHETTDGRYQLPSDFKGQEGRAYQLQFTLSDGTTYISDQQIMPKTVAIQRLYHQFNPNSLPAERPDETPSLVRGASELFVDWQDPGNEQNYYRWDWKLWERQQWCRSCPQGFYYIWNPENESMLQEDCVPIPQEVISRFGVRYFVNDYECRSKCWEIIYNYEINLFSDALSNGGLTTGRLIAKIPYYQPVGCLVEVRQTALTEGAFRFSKQLQEQTQNTGGLADTPPAAPIGNVLNQTNPREAVVGYFTATGVSAIRYWLDRKDATGRAPGLFEAFNGGLLPSKEGEIDPNTNEGKFSIGFSGNSKNRDRPPMAVCEESDNRTAVQPVGWRE